MVRSMATLLGLIIFSLCPFILVSSTPSSSSSSSSSSDHNKNKTFHPKQHSSSSLVNRKTKNMAEPNTSIKDGVSCNGSNNNNDDSDPWSEDKIQEMIRLWGLTLEDEKELRMMYYRLQDVKHPWNAPDVVLGFAFSDGGWKTTEQRFRKMIEWRRDNNIDSLVTDYKPNPLLLDHSLIAFLKDYDKDGDPIYLERGGAVDVKGLLARFPKEDLMRHAIWLREVQSGGAWIEEYERRQGRGIRHITVVYDLHGLSAQHLDPRVMAFFGNLMKITEDYYPGPIKRMIIIRAPHIFRFVWRIVKNFFSKESQDKMIFADSDYLAELEKYMDIDVLPACINPNANGETAIGMPKSMVGGTIPEYVGPMGEGYVAQANATGISTGGGYDIHKETSSHCSSTEDDLSSDDDEDEDGLGRGAVEGFSEELFKEWAPEIIFKSS